MRYRPHGVIVPVTLVSFIRCLFQVVPEEEFQGLPRLAIPDRLASLQVCLAGVGRMVLEGLALEWLVLVPVFLLLAFLPFLLPFLAQVRAVGISC